MMNEEENHYANATGTDCKRAWGRRHVTGIVEGKDVKQGKKLK